MEDSNQPEPISVGHIESDTGDIKRTFWIAREAHRLASEAAKDFLSGDLLSVSFGVCVEIDYVRYHEEGCAKVKSTLNTNLVSTCTGTAVRLEHVIDPIVMYLNRDDKRLYDVVGRVLYRVK